MCLLPAFGVHDGNRVLYCSEELAAMHGAASAEEIVGQEVLSLLAPEAHDTSMAVVSSRLAGRYRSVGIRAGGLKFPVELSSSPIRFHGDSARLFTVRDLSPLAVVVDDEPPVAKMTASLIRRIGYQTTMYTSPVKLLSEYVPGIVSVVVSDVMMPEMDGITMVERLRELDPGLPVAFVSGFTDRVVKANDGTALLAKPFGVQAMREILDRLPDRARAELE